MPGMAPLRKTPLELPRRFRKLPVQERRAALVEALAGPLQRAAEADHASGDTEETFNPLRDFALTGESEELTKIADALVESAIGYFGVPLAIAQGFSIDGVDRIVPLATEEPSVVAACSYGARIVAGSGGFETWACEPVMKGTVYYEYEDSLVETIEALRNDLYASLDHELSSLRNRGGGLRSLENTRAGDFLKIAFLVDVRDAMGANRINTAAERLADRIESATGARAVTAILTNASEGRRAGARFAIPAKHLPPNGLFDRTETARRIGLASRIADCDPDRAVTHNKGIMNGVTALALATGNDTRGIEAAAHAWAGRSGGYAPLSRYSFDGRILTGKIELPLPMATVGGAVSSHPAARTSLLIAGVTGAIELARIAAAVGLAQNFAALLALVSGGIQRGHMPLHARRRTYESPGRGAHG